MKYYVYALADPRTGETFYVGKGKGRRAWQHENAVRSGTQDGNHAKNERIQSILDSGRAVDVQVLERFAEEGAALAEEEHLIATMPNLTNIRSSGMPQSPVALLKGQRARFKHWVDRIMPYEMWQERYPSRSADMYHDVANGHYELLASMDQAILDAEHAEAVSV